jgi:polysaccharide biosynthesis protein PslH
MRVLFYKHDFVWPRASGHDVHTYNMMRAMQHLGTRVGLVTRSAAPDVALDGIEFDLREQLGHDSGRAVQLTRLQERFRAYWGVPTAHISSFAAIARRFRADVAVVSGLDVLPLLGGIEQAARVWYAADEWFWHHISQVSVRDRRSWSEVRPALTKGLYERAYGRCVDRAWVVTDADARAMRLVAGIQGIDVLPNGVDGDWYRPVPNAGRSGTAVFWGRLDFGPNVQGLEWFCSAVWPLVRRQHPNAQFTIIGFNPSAAVQALGAQPGVVLKPNVPDIRTEVGDHAVVVLPFVSGGGIKNKLLEAAAMGRASIGTRRACLGLVGNPPLVIADRPQEWAEALTRLWNDADERVRVGQRLRSWVEAHHSWDTVAQRALAGVQPWSKSQPVGKNPMASVAL